MANTYLTRNFQSGGNRKKWTYSVWFKRGRVSASSGGDMLFQSYTSTYTYCPIQLNNRLRFQDGNGGNKYPYMEFKDLNSWYHLVVAIDTDLSTANDRYKIYVNGTRLTNFETNTNPSQGYEGEWNSATAHNIGRHSAGEQFFHGSMSHVHFCDGYQYQASDFGETDTTTGEWKIKTSPSVSYGTTGFFILKDGNSVTDQSPNSNNWTVSGGTLTKTEDSPSNVFATLNPLYRHYNYTFTNGNNSLEGNNNNNWGITVPATLSATSGKYYWEVRQVAGSHTDYNLFGFIQTDYSYTGSNLISTAYLNGIQTHTSTVTVYNGANSTTYLKAGGSNISVSDNDIVSFALDLDNQKGWVAKNGVWSDDLSGNVGNPTTGANALWISSVIPSGQMYAPVSIQYYDPKCQYNFGNGYFGTTAVSSAGTNASGNGIFEYDTPTGFTALSTKGLNL